MSGRASANGSGFELDGRRVATLNKPFEIRELVAVIERQLASPATASGGQS
jgi:hypothetical protein